MVAVVLLALGGVVGTFALDYYEQPGRGPGEQPIAACDLSADLKSQAHVSSFRLLEKPPEEGLRRTNCEWGQTAGKDGRNPRTLGFHIYDYSSFNPKPEENTGHAESTYDDIGMFAKGLQTKPVEGLGDEAMLIVEPAPRDTIEVELAVRKGTAVWHITYSGWDKGFFSNDPLPLADAEAVVRKTAEELISK